MNLTIFQPSFYNYNVQINNALRHLENKCQTFVQTSYYISTCFTSNDIKSTELKYHSVRLRGPSHQIHVKLKQGKYYQILTFFLYRDYKLMVCMCHVILYILKHDKVKTSTHKTMKFFLKVYCIHTCQFVA